MSDKIQATAEPYTSFVQHSVSFRTAYPCKVIVPYVAPSIFSRPEIAQRLQHRREWKRREFCHRFHTKLQWGLS